MERTDVPICQDPSEPEIPYKMDVCNVYAVFNDPTDRFISVGSTSARTDDPNGFFQHSLGADTAPACNLIPLFPALVCDSYVTVANECSGSGDGSTRDPDFDSTAFNTSGSVAGGWFNADPSNGQGVPDANGRVLIAQFSVKQGRDVTGALSVFATIGGAEDATEFPLQTFDCFGGGGASPSGSGPVPQGAGAGASCGCDAGGGPCLCPDVELGGANEPAMAVNPTNPLNIAVSWNPDVTGPDDSLQQLTVSTDGGRTWCGDPSSLCPAPTDAVLPEDPCSDDGIICVIGGDPSVAFDSSGRLFWAYAMPISPSPYHGPWTDWLVLELDPTTGEILEGPVRVINNEEMSADKGWLTADSTPSSPHANRLYLTWRNFQCLNCGPGQTIIGYTAVSYADDLLNGWAAPAAISPTDNSQGEVWGAHIAVAPNGFVYVAYHSQTGYLPGGNPDGETGKVIVRRSTDGGASWPEALASVAYQEGDADVTWNYQFDGSIPQTKFLNTGSNQPWVVPDPLTVGRVYIIAADDPNNVHGDLEDSRIRIVASNDFGQTWDDLLDPEGKPKLIEPDAPAGTFQVFPTAAIDPVTGDLAVLWYDNRRGQMFLEDPEDPESELLYYLDVFFSISTDQGVTFTAPTQINDLQFNHVLGADGHTGNTKRMGEYIGVGLATDPASATQHLYAVWTGNDDTGQQIFFGTDQCDDCPWDADDDGDVGAFDLAVVLGAWGTNPCGPPDFDGDGDVGPADLAQLLGRWGLCP